MKSFFCFILILLALISFVHTKKHSELCHKELRKVKCSDDECFTKNLKKCYTDTFGIHWEREFLPKDMSKKYDIDDVVKCQAKAFNRCRNDKCTKKMLMKCFTKKFGKEFAHDLMQHLKSEKHRNELKKMIKEQRNNDKKHNEKKHKEDDKEHKVDDDKKKETKIE